MTARPSDAFTPRLPPYLRRGPLVEPLTNDEPVYSEKHRRLVAEGIDPPAEHFAKDAHGTRVPSGQAEQLITRVITSSWAAVDLAPIVAGTAGSDEPVMLRRDDGISCLYDSKVHFIAGESETGKTWFALLAAKQELLAGHHVAFFDFEDNERTLVQRLRDMVIPDDVIVERFHYVRPDAPLDDAGLDDLCMMFAVARPTLAIIDGVTEAMVLHGYELKDNTDIARWLARVPKRLANWGTAVLQIDHVAKDREGRGRFAIGGQHKLAGIDGAAYTIEVVKPFGRGMSGVARVYVAKDRPGWIRQHAPGGLVGELHVDSDPDGGVGLELVAPAVHDGAPFGRPS